MAAEKFAAWGKIYAPIYYWKELCTANLIVWTGHKTFIKGWFTLYDLYDTILLCYYAEFKVIYHKSVDLKGVLHN